MNGSGTPVIGNNPITIPIFSNIWKMNIPVMPEAMSDPVSFFAVFATYKHFAINSTYSIITVPAIINPISSPITANIKSVVLGYKNPNCV